MLGVAITATGRLVWALSTLLYCITTLDLSSLPRVEEHAWYRHADPLSSVNETVAAGGWGVAARGAHRPMAGWGMLRCDA